MKILVTGGAGYIGSICVEILLDTGHEVSVFDNLSEGHRSAVDSRASLIEGDLRNPRSILAAMSERPDAVMHFAANALVGESMQNPIKYFENNVGGGLNLLKAMIDQGVPRIIFSSTCATYGEPETVPISEETPQNPVNPYGQSKLMFEQMLRWASEIHGITHVNLRYFNAAGASEKFGEDHKTETHLIPNVLRVALGKRAQVDIFGGDHATPDGTCIRDYIHIRDLAEAHRLALEASESRSFNLGTGTGTSVKEIIDAAREITGHAIPAERKPPRAGDPPRLVAKADRIREELGWTPHFGVRDIVASAWAWHQKNPDGYQD